MRYRWGVIALWMGSTLLVGCPSPSPANDGGAVDPPVTDGATAASPIAIEQLGDAYVSGVCSVILQCYSSYFAYCSAAHCESDTAPLGYAALLAEIDAGWTAYDPVAAGNCYQSRLADPCGSFGFAFTVPTIQQTLAGCPGVFTGQRTVGQSCASVADCVNGTTCVANGSCPGTCRALLEAGAACGSTGSAPCDPSQNLTCRGGSCQPPWALGDACAFSADCSPDYWCNRDAGQCAAPASLGKPCERFGTDEARCQRDLWCDSRFAIGACRERSSVDGPCLDDWDCASPLSCMPPPDGGVFGNGSCGPRRSGGAPCDSWSDCVKGFSCAASQTCTAYPGLGQSCSNAFGAPPCSDGLLCNGSVCVTALCPGQSCGAAQTACAESTCSTSSSSCEVRLALGATCTSGPQCASGTCSTGRCADSSCRP